MYKKIEPSPVCCVEVVCVTAEQGKVQIDSRLSCVSCVLPPPLIYRDRVSMWRERERAVFIVREFFG